MATRLLDQNPVYFNNDLTVCAGGELRFYESESTTPLNVYSSPTLGTSLGSTVTLDASGRAEDDIWLAVDAYRVRLYTSAGEDGTLVWSRDYAGDIAEGAVVVPDPATGNEDDVLSTDGVNYSLRAIREVPDPTGHIGEVLKATSATAWAWQAEQTIPEYDADSLPGGITAESGRIVIGNFAIVTGSGTAPNTGTLKSSVSVTFGTAFSGAPTYIGIGVASASSTGEGAGASAQYTSPSASGFTANFFVGAEDQGGVAEINGTIPFTYVAIGPV